MTYLEEVTGGHGSKFIEVISAGMGYTKCRARLYGRYLLTRKGKPRLFMSEEAAEKAMNAEIKLLKKQTEAMMKAMAE